MKDNGEYCDHGECAACDMRRIFDRLEMSAREVGYEEEHIGPAIAGAIMQLLAERGYTVVTLIDVETGEEGSGTIH